jgi:hypothetical protein
MRMRIALCVVLLGVSLPGLAFASQGILLLADEGKAEWNTDLRQLAASVDKQKPTELAFWSATNPNVQAAVDRLIQRGVSEIVAVPLFVAAPPSDLKSRVTSSVPLRVTAGLKGDPIVADIVMSRAQEISRNAATEVLMLVSHRSTAGDHLRWVPDLSAAAEQLNRARSVAAVVTWTIPADASEASATAVNGLRAVLKRHVAQGRGIIVVPVLTSYGGTEAVIEEQLQGLVHKVARRAMMPDDRLVAWIISHTNAVVSAEKR